MSICIFVNISTRTDIYTYMCMYTYICMQYVHTNIQEDLSILKVFKICTAVTADDPFQIPSHYKAEAGRVSHCLINMLM